MRFAQVKCRIHLFENLGKMLGFIPGKRLKMSCEIPFRFIIEDNNMKTLLVNKLLLCNFLTVVYKISSWNREAFDIEDLKFRRHRRTLEHSFYSSNTISCFPDITTWYLQHFRKTKAAFVAGEIYKALIALWPPVLKVVSWRIPTSRQLPSPLLIIVIKITHQRVSHCTFLQYSQTR